VVAPTLNPTGEVIYTWLGRALTDPDSENGWALAWLVEVATASLDEAEQVTRGRDGRVGWQIAFDPDETPVELLPWLAQFVGETFPSTLPAADRRARLLAPSGWYRGTPNALRRAVREQLAGSQSVTLMEKYTGDPFLVRVTVYTSQVPDQDALEAAIVAALPAAIDYDLNVLAGQTWNDLMAGHADWDAVMAAYDSWDELLEDV
jgi:hypothetical protein